MSSSSSQSQNFDYQPPPIVAAENHAVLFCLPLSQKNVPIPSSNTSIDYGNRLLVTMPNIVSNIKNISITYIFKLLIFFLNINIMISNMVLSKFISFHH